MRMEGDTYRISCEDFPRSSESPQMDHDAAGDHRRSGRWHTVRYGRMRRPRPRRTARLLFRNAGMCSRTRASLEMTSDRSCVSMQKNTTFAHGLVVDRVYQIIEYEPNPCFRRFGESVSTARRAGDEDPDKAIIADTMKLLGNSGYGKDGPPTLIGIVMSSTAPRSVHQRSSTTNGFDNWMSSPRTPYEIEMNKSVVKYTLPLHIGFFVCQYAKLRMLQFYYDFVDRYVERPLFQYCEMDTDSAYIALAGESIDGLVRADRRAHFFRHRSQWLPAECCDEHEDDYVRARIAGRSWTATESCCFARKAFDKRTLGLFKVEWCGGGFIGLCSKTYYCFGATDKYSTKGLSKRHNDIGKDTFLLPC